MSTVPEAVTVSPVSEVAPASVHELNLSTVSVPLVTVITGAVVSITKSGIVILPAFPAVSVIVMVSPE